MNKRQITSHIKNWKEYLSIDTFLGVFRQRATSRIVGGKLGIDTMIKLNDEHNVIAPLVLDFVPVHDKRCNASEYYSSKQDECRAVEDGCADICH